MIAQKQQKPYFIVINWLVNYPLQLFVQQLCVSVGQGLQTTDHYVMLTLSPLLLLRVASHSINVFLSCSFMGCIYYLMKLY